jgi:hypothetical protein
MNTMSDEEAARRLMLELARHPLIEGVSLSPAARCLWVVKTDLLGAQAGTGMGSMTTEMMMQLTDMSRAEVEAGMKQLETPKGSRRARREQFAVLDALEAA